MLFRLLQQMIKDRPKMKARESPLPEKTFSRREGANVVPTPASAARARENAAQAARPVRGSPPGEPFGFVAKMYGLNVAQGREQYSTKIRADALDIGGALM
jgi:hypothetical protein